MKDSTKNLIAYLMISATMIFCVLMSVEAVGRWMLQRWGI